MRTIETNIYTFGELSEDMQEKAIENLYDINTFFDWWESTCENAAIIGLNITSFDLDRCRRVNGEMNFAANEVAANIFRDHGEGCETYKTAQAFMKEWEPLFFEYMDETNEKYESAETESDLQDLESEFLKNLLEDYSIILQNEFEYLQSEEAIKETIESNEYEFTADGKLI